MSSCSISILFILLKKCDNVLMTTRICPTFCSKTSKNQRSIHAVLQQHWHNIIMPIKCCNNQRRSLFVIQNFRISSMFQQDLNWCPNITLLFFSKAKKMILYFYNFFSSILTCHVERCIATKLSFHIQFCFILNQQFHYFVLTLVCCSKNLQKTNTQSRISTSWAAFHNGVELSHLRQFTFAPLSSKNLATSVCPL